MDETLEFETEEEALENHQWVLADEYYELKKLGLLGDENDEWDSTNWKINERFRVKKDN